jgi:hypothetical protein
MEQLPPPPPDEFAAAAAALASDWEAANAAVATSRFHPYDGGRRGSAARSARPRQPVVCFRCGEAGHVQSRCHQRDERVLRPRGIPARMLRSQEDGRFVLASGDVVGLVPNTAAFQREMAMMKGLYCSSSSS